MLANRWANLTVILILIFIVVPAGWVYGVYVGGSSMAKHFPEVERLGFLYGAMESTANVPLVGGVLAKGQCDGLRRADEDANHIPQWKGVSEDYRIPNVTAEIRKACSNP